MDYWASCALYNLVYYASCVHGNIHVLHYLLTAALHESSQDFSALNDWAKFYATHVPEKYAQVGDLLVRSQPDIFEVLSNKGTAGTVADTYALLTGSLGFGIGSDGDKLRNILTRMLNIWTTDPTNYIDNMLSAPKDKLLKAGFLTEFMKHHDLVPAFAKDVADALESTDDKKFTIAEDRLKVSHKISHSMCLFLRRHLIHMTDLPGIGIKNSSSSISALELPPRLTPSKSGSNSWQSQELCMAAHLATLVSLLTRTYSVGETFE